MTKRHARISFVIQERTGLPPFRWTVSLRSGVHLGCAKELLKALHEDPTAAFDSENAADFKRYVEQPLQDLLSTVAGRLLPFVTWFLQSSTYGQASVRSPQTVEPGSGVHPGVHNPRTTGHSS